jgi:beta-lactamase regulating signal transducer with metallopeptidase domain
MLWSMGGRASILLPRALMDHLDDAQLDTLLTHELAHFKRKDHWVRLLELVVTALYWWHPVVYT